ncbi:hypothetical protein PO124_25955, partial [Bacillus licheniformis]|nr:hypothetical protein [Bacillus licheniformis]
LFHMYVFYRIQIFLIVLFAPTIIVMLINPPFPKKGVFRFIAGLYLLLLALATYFGFEHKQSGYKNKVASARGERRIYV